MDIVCANSGHREGWEAWCAAVHRVTKSWTRLSDWTTAAAYKGLLSLWKALISITALFTYLKQPRTLQFKTKCACCTLMPYHVSLIYTNTQQRGKVAVGGGTLLAILHPCTLCLINSSVPSMRRVRAARCALGPVHNRVICPEGGSTIWRYV